MGTYLLLGQTRLVKWKKTHLHTCLLLKTTLTSLKVILRRHKSGINVDAMTLLVVKMLVLKDAKNTYLNVKLLYTILTQGTISLVLTILQSFHHGWQTVACL